MSKSNTTLINLIGLFIIWYAVNCAYSVYNSKVKDDLEFPIAVAILQLIVGVVYVVPLWLLGIRKMPKLTISDIIKILPIVALNALGHVATVVATFQKGGGSFTHVIKASEPVVSTLLSVLIIGAIPTPLAGLSLLPITYGVAYASTLGNLNIATMSKELSSKAALFAMVSNFAFALRSIRRKNITDEFRKRTELTPENDHAVTTILSSLLLIPFFFYNENLADIQKVFNTTPDRNQLLLNIFICGMCYYIYNEVQNIVLGSLGPVPTAVGNTLKRVAIFVALFYFTEGETFPLPKIIGCTIAIVGCLAYAIFNTYKL